MADCFSGSLEQQFQYVGHELFRGIQQHFHRGSQTTFTNNLDFSYDIFCREAKSSVSHHSNMNSEFGHLVL